MLPAAFSKLFEGESNYKTQRICRDMKLMNAVFEMTVAPYNRVSINPKLPAAKRNRPFSPGRSGKREMASVRCVSKLAYVTMQRMFCNNHSNQVSFYVTVESTFHMYASTLYSVR